MWGSVTRATMLAAAIVMTGCATTRSSRLPLTSQDREGIQQLWRQRPLAPRLDAAFGSSKPVVFAVLFDGTRNDREQIPEGERQTVVAEIYDVLKKNGHNPVYYAGAGTQVNKLLALIDSVIGFTLIPTAEKACKEIVSRIAKARSHDPDADIRVVVAGFSRGAATARHFMNITQRRCGPADTSPWSDSPHFYALLYDTVATGQGDVLELGLPEMVDVAYHYVSIDERRLLFKPLVDKPANTAAGRINTYFVAGVHSDVGASYPMGVGSEYRVLTEHLLAELGLSGQRMFQLDVDAAGHGKHDSRWPLERLFLILPANVTAGSSRTVINVPAATMSAERQASWRQRITAMIPTVSDLLTTNRRDSRYPVFDVTRMGSSFSLMPMADEPWIYDPRIEERSDGHWLTYSVVTGGRSRVKIPPRLLQEIREKPKSLLEIGVVLGEGGTDLTWILDGRVRSKIGYFPDSRSDWKDARK